MPEETPESWRQRAAEATQSVKELNAKLDEVERALNEAKGELAASERRRDIQRRLLETDPVDLETAVVLTEAAVAAMPAPDVAAAVADLRKRKPFLFRDERRPSAMGPAGHEPDRARAAALEARAAGDRRTLLEYLKLRK